MDAGTSDLLSRIGREASPLVLPRLQRDAAAQFVKARIGGSTRAWRRGCSTARRETRCSWARWSGCWNEQGAAAITDGVVPDGVRDVSASAWTDWPARRARCWSWPRSPATDRSPAAGGRRRAGRGLGVGAPGGGRARGRRRAPRRPPALRPRPVPRGAVPRSDEDRRRALHGQVARRAGADRLRRRSPRSRTTRWGARATCSTAPSTTPIRAAARAQELLAYEEAVATLDARARPSPPRATRRRRARACCWRWARRASGAASPTVGKDYCREAAAAARELGDAELGAHAALTYGRVFTFARRRPGAGGAARGIAARAARRRQRAARPPAGAAGGRDAARACQNDEPVRAAHEAIAIARRLGDERGAAGRALSALSALMDTVDPAESARPQPGGRAAGGGAGR